MDQSINSMELAKLAAAAVGMSLAGKMTKGAGTAADGQFQKLLEKVKTTEKPVQGQDAKTEGQPQDKATAEQPKDTQAEKPQTDGTQQAKGAEDDQAADVWADSKELAKRLLESGLLAGAEPVYVDQAAVQEITEETVQTLEGTVSVQAVEDGTIDVEQLADVWQHVEADVQPEDQPGEEQPQETAQVQQQPVQTQQHEAEPQTQVKEVEEEQSEAPEEDLEVKVTDHDGGAQPLFHDVKAAPIKVAENPEAQQAEDVNNQIAAQVIPAFEGGQTKVELQLNPAALGSVKVEIVQGENGALHITISAQEGQTRNLLVKHMDGLQTILAQRSGTSVQVEVQRQEESQPKNPYDGHNSQQQHQQQQEQRRPRHSENSQDFLHQLRLGLVEPTEEL